MKGTSLSSGRMLEEATTSSPGSRTETKLALSDAILITSLPPHTKTRPSVKDLLYVILVPSHPLIW
jgi:hypothetical protein